jgi:hypothetical protein
MSLLAAISLPQSPFPPIALGFFGLGTGNLIYGPQELSVSPSAMRAWTSGPASGASGCPGSASSSFAVALDLSLKYTLYF